MDIISGIICAIIAYDKNRNWICWFFIGCVFSFLGFIVVLLVDEIKEEEKD